MRTLYVNTHYVRNYYTKAGNTCHSTCTLEAAFLAANACSYLCLDMLGTRPCLIDIQLRLVKTFCCETTSVLLSVVLHCGLRLQNNAAVAEIYQKIQLSNIPTDWNFCFSYSLGIYKRGVIGSVDL